MPLLLPKRPPALYNSPEEESLWREVTVAPDRSFHTLNLKFRDLEAHGLPKLVARCRCYPR